MKGGIIVNDSSVSRRPNQIRAIKDAISSGTLDAQTIHNALLAEISLELNKPIEEIDVEYVNACEDLLILLNRDRAASVESHYFSNLNVIRQKLKHRARISSPSSGALRVGVALCLSVFFVFGGVLLSADHLKVTVSPDGEQLIVQGVPQQESTRSLADGFSDGVRSHNIFDTSSYKEAVELFGAPPHIPQWLPDSWKATLYSVDDITAYKRFTVSYRHTQSQEILTFSDKSYTDTSLLRLELEQNAPGNQLVMDDGLTVYYSQNYDLVTAQWQMGHSLCTFYGTISIEDILHCILSIKP